MELKCCFIFFSKLNHFRFCFYISAWPNYTRGINNSCSMVNDWQVARFQTAAVVIVKRYVDAICCFDHLQLPNYTNSKNRMYYAFSLPIFLKCIVWEISLIIWNTFVLHHKWPYHGFIIWFFRIFFSLLFWSINGWITTECFHIYEYRSRVKRIENTNTVIIII